MKKTLVALAALAVVGVASAQSSVTLYGTMDAGLTGVTGDTANRTGMLSSGIGSSKLGFTGTEDLGGGLKANFKIEGAVNADNGSANGGLSTNNQRSGTVSLPAIAPAVVAAPSGLGGQQGFVFNRFSYVGLSGGWGEVRLGRDYISTFLIQVSVDPMATNGVADALLLLARGASSTFQATTANGSNMIGYTTPVIAGGLTANVQYWMGENSSAAANSDAGNGYALSARYSNGPIFVGLGTQTTRGVASVATATAQGTTGDFTSSSLAASYNFGAAKVTYTYSREAIDGPFGVAGTQLTNSTNHLGLAVPLGATTIKATYGRSTFNTGAPAAPDTIGTLISVGADYALSKRTKVYATLARVSNDGASVFATGGLAGGLAPVGGATTAWMMGVNHTF